MSKLTKSIRFALGAAALTVTACDNQTQYKNGYHGLTIEDADSTPRDNLTCHLTTTTKEHHIMTVNFSPTTTSHEVKSLQSGFHLAYQAKNNGAEIATVSCEDEKGLLASYHCKYAEKTAIANGMKPRYSGDHCAQTYERQDALPE